MVRYTKDKFLTLYSKYLQDANQDQKANVQLTFKRYDAVNEERLNPSADKTSSDPRPVDKNNNNKKNKKSKNSKHPSRFRGAANPELAPSIKKSSATPEKPSVLIRAKFGDEKASCVIVFDEIDAFNNEFGTIFRVHNKNLVPEGKDSQRLQKRKLASKKNK